MARQYGSLFFSIFRDGACALNSMKDGNATNSCPCRSGSWPTMCLSQIPDLRKEHSVINTAVFYTSAIYHSSNNTKNKAV